MNIGFIGAGNVARNLGTLLSTAGHRVVYGTPAPKADVIAIADAIAQSEVVCFAIPYAAMQAVLSANRAALAGKIVVDITNAINLKDWSPVFLGEDSGGEQTARLVPEARVVKAFNTIFADVMHQEPQRFEGNRLTAFIASDDAAAAGVIRQLAQDAGFHGLIVGGIKNARYLEAMAHLNIAIALGGGGTQAGFAYLQRTPQ